jgi:hypothetical protein
MMRRTLRGIIWGVGSISLLGIGGCGRSRDVLDTAALTPLINARHTADNAVRSLKDLYCEQPDSVIDGKLSESERICRETRLRYNRTATSVNTVLSQLTLSIESNSNIANDRYFKQEVERSITAAFELDKFLQDTLSRPSGLSKLPLPVGLTGLTGLVDALIGTIPSFSAAVSKANDRQKAFMVCELKALKLQPFDSLEQPTEISNCAALLNR